MFAFGFLFFFLNLHPEQIFLRSQVNLGPTEFKHEYLNILKYLFFKYFL